MIKKLSSLFLVLCMCTALHATIQPQLEQSDRLYNSRDTIGNLEQALNILNAALSKANTPDEKHDCYWRIAQASHAVEDYTDKTKKEKLALLTKGIEAGVEAERIKPDNITGIYWHGIVIGKEAELKGIMKSLKSVKPIRKKMEKILSLDPDYARAYFVLSRLFRKAPKMISIGNPKQSLIYINKALSYDSNESLYLLEKAEVLIKLKKHKDAIPVLNTLISLPYNPIYFKDTVLKNQKEGQALLNKVQH
ncbi:hypothetical protein DID78_04960 [Candidatus Marinamargulisbacteria bacterium SCGC AG-343-D04]|nr:hypothetical protein DID78_04960 [Candidatus Marinamargulisbacteria bacterium SCGC AG-343-D04]